MGLPIYLLAVWYDALDTFLEFTNEPQSDAIDWLVILFVFLGIAAKIYSVRRTIDLRHEVVRRRKAETEAYQLARHDVLTGLPNRRWFIEDFDKWSCELPAGEACALLVVDLDNFKPINDVYGHRLGDEVLRVIAKRLTRLAEGVTIRWPVTRLCLEYQAASLRKGARTSIVDRGLKLRSDGKRFTCRIGRGNSLARRP